MAGRIVVTGAAGFLGMWVVKRLLEQGWHVTAFDRAPGDRRLRWIAGDAAAALVAWRTGDIADPETVAAVIGAAQPDVVLHLAAVLVPVCRDDPVTGARVDVIGHINVFEAAADTGCRHVVYASSASANLRGKDGALATVYGTFKHWNEEFAATRLRDRGMASVGLRPAMVYGPGRETGGIRFVDDALADIVAGRPHVLTTRWRFRVEYVETVAEAFVRCAAARVEGAHVSDVTTVETDEADFMAALRRAAPGCEIGLEAAGSFREPVAPDASVLEALIGPLEPIGFDEGIPRSLAMMRRPLPPHTL